MMPFFGYNSFLCGPLYCQHMSVEDGMLEAVALKSSATIGSHSFSKANSGGVWEVLCFQLSFKFVKTRLWSLPMSAHGTSLSWPCSCWNEYWQQNIIDLIMDQSLWWVIYFYCVCKVLANVSLWLCTNSRSLRPLSLVLTRPISPIVPALSCQASGLTLVFQWPNTVKMSFFGTAFTTLSSCR